jgi:hypothetical protein
VGFENIFVGGDGKGYGICDFTANVGYNDYAEFGDSGNWAPPTVLSHSATSVEIARATSDGNWTLTQTFSQIAGTSPSLKIAMALKNNTAMDGTNLHSYQTKGKNEPSPVKMTAPILGSSARR